MSDKAYSTFLLAITGDESDCYPLHFLSRYMRCKKLFMYKQAIQGKEIRQLLSNANYTASKANLLFYDLKMSIQVFKDEQDNYGNHKLWLEGEPDEE